MVKSLKMADEEDDNVIIQSEHKRARSKKVLEEKLHSKINARSGKLRQLTAKSNEIELLMETDCNLNEVENKQLKNLMMHEVMHQCCCI